MKLPLPYSLRLLLLGGALSLAAVTHPASAQSLIINGDFENSGAYPWGGSAFSHPHFSSGYVLAPWYLGESGSYAIANAERGGPDDRWNANPKDYNYNFRNMTSAHNGSSGMLLVNGAVGANAAGTTVWESEFISISPYISYEFTLHITNLIDITTWPWAGGAEGEQEWRASQAILSFEVFHSGHWEQFGNRIDLTTVTNPDDWHRYSILFASNDSSPIKLRLVNQQTSVNGNDFALDDLSLAAAAIPEPSTYALIGLASAAAVLARRKRLTR